MSMQVMLTSNVKLTISGNTCTTFSTDKVGFNIPLHTVISEIIFPTNHLAGTSRQIKQQPHYNTNNLNDTYK